MLVNPKHATVDGEPCHPDVASLPETPDLAVIATPADAVPGLVAALGARGTKAAVVITAGFGEGAGRPRPGPAPGDARRGAAAPAAHRRPELPWHHRCQAAASTPPLPTSAPSRASSPSSPSPARSSRRVLDWAAARNIGFSHLVSVGDMADVDFGDLLDYLALDPATSAILLYVEA